MLQGLARRLELTDEQATKIRTLATEHGKAHRELMGSLDTACFTRLEAEKDRFDSEVRVLLTPEQQQRFDELLAQQADRFGHRGQRKGQSGRGPGHGRVP
jgi:Spy/CpxP family protein refolding chaperone